MCHLFPKFSKKMQFKAMLLPLKCLLNILSMHNDKNLSFLRRRSIGGLRPIECKMYKDTSAYHDKIMLIYILDPPWSEQYKRRYYYRNYLK